MRLYFVETDSPLTNPKVKVIQTILGENAAASIPTQISMLPLIVI